MKNFTTNILISYNVYSEIIPKEITVANSVDLRFVQAQDCTQIK